MNGTPRGVDMNHGGPGGGPGSGGSHALTMHHRSPPTMGVEPPLHDNEHYFHIDKPTS